MIVLMSGAFVAGRWEVHVDTMDADRESKMLRADSGNVGLENLYSRSG